MFFRRISYMIRTGAVVKSAAMVLFLLFIYYIEV